MAKIIVETPSFDPDITVPEGTDSRADAAEVVEALTQKLANRSQFLKGYTDNAARVDVANTFEQPNTFLERLLLDVLDGAHPAISVERTAGEGSVTWKPILRMRLVQSTSGSASAILYVSSILSNERMMLVTNAEWAGTAWHQNDSTKSSTAIIFSSTGTEALGIGRMPAGSANWTTWGFGKLTASDFAYNKTRVVPIPLGGSSIEYDETAPYKGGMLAMSAIQTHQIPLRLPENSGGGIVQIAHYKADTVVTNFAIVGYSMDSWTTPTSLNLTEVTATASAAGYQITPITMPSIVAGTEYRLRWDPANLGDRLLAMRLNAFSDLGPLNTL